ncbi:MAG: hypothetical protein JWQ87_799 [Candidatus Sulfotelmatobacter sp.]|nr:hypothetical protein [Candidatus Sulfotelmatobacter sp.]
MKFKFYLASFLSMLFLGSAYSQTAPEAGRDWDLGVWVAAATGEEHLNSFSEAQIVSAGVFAGKILTSELGSGWRRGRFEYGVAFIPVFRQLRPQSIYGIGFEPMILRWNSSLRASGVAPYIELGGGAVRTNTNFPTGDTSNFNFMVRGGGGIQILRNRSRSLEIGCRWWHISNANLGVRNPEFNGIQISVGYHWFK